MRLILRKMTNSGMTLISSISGIRGTIGGVSGEALTPEDIIRFTNGYARWVRERHPDGKKLVVGRDARISGDMVSRLVTGTLIAWGWDVIDLGLSTTPTTELAVMMEEASGGIIITASHNPKQWNALKLLNERGEFLEDTQGKRVLALAGEAEVSYPGVNGIGRVRSNDTYLDKHIELVLAHPLVDIEAVKKASLKVVLDCVNSTGGVIIPRLLKAMGVDDRVELFCAPNGRFPHNPEPLPQNLVSLSNEVRAQKADLGIAVDPDVDRLAFICEDGTPFGEEYTLVAIADYVLRHQPGPTVSNLSSSRALQDITQRHGQSHHSAAVGEVNVIAQMKAVDAVVGGEGNGGVIIPSLHYGRDAVAGLALFLSHLAQSSIKASQLRARYPNYFMTKSKIQLEDGVDLDFLLKGIRERYAQYPVNTTDGVKIDFDSDWVHLRRSNTEPIIRIYAESTSATTADNLADKLKTDFRELLK